MRVWLAEKCFSLPKEKITFVFSHGGLLTTAFGPTERCALVFFAFFFHCSVSSLSPRSSFGNCEMRVLDLYPDGSFDRVTPPEEITPSLRVDLPICPLSLQPIKDAAVDPDGNLYEYSKIVEWVGLNGTSPLTSRKLSIRLVFVLSESLFGCVLLKLKITSGICDRLRIPVWMPSKFFLFSLLLRGSI